MRRGAYYNENDPFAATWLRELIKEGAIADGDVDERSIEDVASDDLRGYTQHHFFAGIGVWSYALRCAGWPDDQPIWTGSCPCQPFSAAGKGAGFADERHLWPAWRWLVEECRPDIVLGEQVEGPAGGAWFDLVSSDLEDLDYACGQAVFPAAGLGAPHIRSRRYWMASALRPGRSKGWAGPGVGSPSSSFGFAVADDTSSGRPWIRKEPAHSVSGSNGQGAVRLGDSGSSRSGRHARTVSGTQGEGQGEWRRDGRQSDESIATDAALRTLVDAEGEQAGFPGRAWQSGGADPWADPDWIWCRDGKYRPVEPGAFPLAHGAPARVGRLRGYGNGLVAPAAQVFVECVMDWLDYGDLL